MENLSVLNSARLRKFVASKTIIQTVLVVMLPGGVSSDWLVVMLIASSFSFPTPVKKDIDHGNEVISGQRQENKMADEPW